jgi:hypothetical protein
MSDPLKNLEGLAARARQEQVPRSDVARQVLYRIGRRRTREVAADRSFMLFAVASVAAAVVVFVLTASLFNTITDPLWTLFQTAPIVAP